MKYERPSRGFSLRRWKITELMSRELQVGKGHEMRFPGASFMKVREMSLKDSTLTGANESRRASASPAQIFFRIKECLTSISESIGSFRREVTVGGRTDPVENIFLLFVLCPHQLQRACNATDYRCVFAGFTIDSFRCFLEIRRLEHIFDC